ncbi:MAG: sugar ABC transporter permease [Anaerolineae bacterium]|nr:sugar ABC transporter permease [Anaerolineae bacterium]
MRLFLAPFLIGMAVLVVLPALATLVLAFTRYNALQPPVWIGLQNFSKLLASPLVGLSLRNTLLFIGLAVPLRLMAALGLALLLRPSGRRFAIHRAVAYLPTLIPEAAYALIWLRIFNPLYGPLNHLLALVGLPLPTWLTDPTSARLAIIIMLVFQMGEGFLVLLAGLHNTPQVYYEAARMDGASAWQILWRITLPLLLPWILLLTCRDILASLQATFTPTYILTYGGPYYATMFFPLLIYELSFDFVDYGLASALLVMMYALMALLIVAILRLARAGGVDV